MLIKIPVLSLQSPDLYPVTYDKGLQIKGTIKEQGVDLECRVRLYHKPTGRIVADTATDKTGNYAFDHLNRSKFFIVAHHPASQFNAVIQDNVVPK